MSRRYIAPKKYASPRKPAYNKGILVIETDDGALGNYTHWLPLFVRKNYEHNQWIGNKTVVLTPCINTFLINTAGYMTTVQLQELVNDYGWETQSHGKHHISIGEHLTVAEASAGQNRIDIDGASMLGSSDLYEFAITDSLGNTETFKIVEAYGTSYNDGYVIIDKNLLNTYSVGSKVQLTDAGAETLLKGCIDDLEAWGLPCRHHVYTYHAGGDHYPSQKSKDWIEQYFNSGRGSATDNGLNGADTDVLNLKSLLIPSSVTTALLDSCLDSCSANDSLFMVYGHGETTSNVLDLIEYLIDGALTRGIRIMTKTDALKRKGLMP